MLQEYKIIRSEKMKPLGLFIAVLTSTGIPVFLATLSFKAVLSLNVLLSIKNLNTKRNLKIILLLYTKPGDGAYRFSWAFCAYFFPWSACQLSSELTCDTQM